MSYIATGLILVLLFIGVFLFISNLLGAIEELEREKD